MAAAAVGKQSLDRIGPALRQPANSHYRYSRCYDTACQCPATQEPGCLNRHSEQPCPQDPSRQCLVWKAGSALAAGAEVCNGYKYMPNDKSFLQYGYLQVCGD